MDIYVFDAIQPKIDLMTILPILIWEEQILIKTLLYLFVIGLLILMQANNAYDSRL